MGFAARFVPIMLALSLARWSMAQQTGHFPAQQMMNIGVYYYPEAWPENQWVRDIANIKKMGMEFVHMGEFAWAFMEPKDGQFQFDWLEKNVELCAKQGLKVVLCTPSPTPPVWLVREHPEVLMIDALGRRMDHGSREHACWIQPKYREHVAGIVDQLGRRFANNPAVWGWQIDNELSHYGKDYCYCDVCRDQFRAWLKNKYGTIANLNRDWGNAFWSQIYSDFDQISIPNPQQLPQQVNPHAQLDFQRWFSRSAADYIRFQARALRKHVGGKQWVTANFMNMHGAVYPPLSGKDLDITTWTLYPVHGQPNQGPLGFRLGDAAEMSFMHDYTRSINGLQGLMELQPGQVNWGDVNPQPYPGAIYMWIMRAFAADARLVCTYRYRQPLSGGELYHSGLVGPDGVTPSTGGVQFSKAAADVAKLRQHYRANVKEPVEYAARRTAILYNIDNRWDIENHKQTARWNTVNHVLCYYRALKRLGCPIDVITEDKDFAKYPFLIAPAYQLVDEALVKRWQVYAENGGHLILTCRTAQKDRRGHLWEAPWAAPIHDLIGATVPSYDVLPEAIQGKVAAGGIKHDWGTWGEVLSPREGTQVLATYADQFYSGKAAVVTRKLGRGSVTYVGVESLSGELESQLMRGVFQQASVKVEQFDEGLLIDWRDGFWIATNFSSKPQTLVLPPGTKMLIGSEQLAPAGVAVWQQ